MAATWRDRISSDDGVLAGKPVIRGTRIAVELVLELLAAGWTIDDVLEQYPGLRVEDVRACFALARDAVAARRSAVPTAPPEE